MKLRRRFLTLMEIMVVILLIMMITGVIAYNYSGSLNEGKAAKTNMGIERITNILEIVVANNPEELDRLETDWPALIANSPLVKNPKAFLTDGWGEKYDVRVENGKIIVTSDRLDEYKKSHGQMFKE